MPHCIIEHTQGVLNALPKVDLLKTAHQVMLDSMLFGAKDIKTRALPTHDYIMGEYAINEGDYVHIVIYLLDGRTVEQKQTLTHAMGKALREKLPSVASISVNIIDMVRVTYAKDVL